MKGPTPAGVDQFVLARSEPAQGRGFPSTGPPDIEKAMPMASQHKIEIMGSLPK